MQRKPPINMAPNILNTLSASGGGIISNLLIDYPGLYNLEKFSAQNELDFQYEFKNSFGKLKRICYPFNNYPKIKIFIDTIYLIRIILLFKNGNPDCFIVDFKKISSAIITGRSWAD